MEMRELSVPEQTPLPRTPRSPLAAPPRDCGASQSGSQRCTPKRTNVIRLHSFVLLFKLEVVRLYLPASHPTWDVLSGRFCAFSFDHSTSIRRLNVIFSTYPFHPLHRLSKSWRKILPGRHSSVLKYHPLIPMFTTLHWEDVHPHMPGFHPTWDVL